MILKGRLFWKILLGFWLAIVLVSQLLWLGFRAERDPRKSTWPSSWRTSIWRWRQPCWQRGIEAATALEPGHVAAAAADNTPDVSDAPPPASAPGIQAASLRGTWPGQRADTHRDCQRRADLSAADQSGPASSPAGLLPAPSWLNIPPPMLWIGGLGTLVQHSVRLAPDPAHERPAAQLRSGSQRGSGGQTLARSALAPGRADGGGEGVRSHGGAVAATGRGREAASRRLPRAKRSPGLHPDGHRPGGSSARRRRATPWRGSGSRRSGWTG